MKEKRISHCMFALVILYIAVVTSCVHDPSFVDDDMGAMPADTMPINTDMNPQDTVIECDSTVIYFTRQVLPLLKSNCAVSGCHNRQSAQDGVILESFTDVMASNVVTPFDLNDSDLYEVLTETDPSKRMPPPPANQLTTDQIELISRWIFQGAKDETCGDTLASGCTLVDVTFQGNVAPVINTNCRSCHSGVSPSGNIDLSNYEGVRNVALNGRLLGAIEHQSGFAPMPQGSDKLDNCAIDQIKVWLADGALNN